jgi:uncharacterized membrane protein
MGSSIEKTHSLVRLEVFSDAVTAVAMTILVLDLKPPEITAAILADRFDFGFLRHHAPKFIAFFVSFFAIATMWMAMVSGLRRATRATLPLMWLTLGHLFFTCLVPWTAAFWSEHPLLAQAVVTYMALWTVLFANGTLLQRYVWKTFRPDDAAAAFGFKYNVAMTSLMLTGTVLTVAVSVYIGFVVVVAVTLLALIPLKPLSRALSLLSAGWRRPEATVIPDPE